eukprot:scaffold46469_cov130-Amphora_coffeaeformis.AAC.1
MKNVKPSCPPRRRCWEVAISRWPPGPLVRSRVVFGRPSIQHRAREHPNWFLSVICLIIENRPMWPLHMTKNRDASISSTKATVTTTTMTVKIYSLPMDNPVMHIDSWPRLALST